MVVPLSKSARLICNEDQAKSGLERSLSGRTPARPTIFHDVAFYLEIGGAPDGGIIHPTREPL